MHVERTVTIACPAEIVFDHIASGSLNTEWRTGVRELALMTGFTGQGAIYRQIIVGPAGHDIDCDYLITRHDPPRRIEFAVISGPARPTGSFDLIERNGHTQVTFCVDAAPRGLRRLVAPLWARVFRAEVAKLEQLKTVLEGDRSAV
jgi:uncharacterized protein YndB with AHSA1/START domain